jgi:hypothetical protein
MIKKGHFVKLFYKKRLFDGHRQIYCCGIKIFSYHKELSLPDYSFDVMKFKGLMSCKNIKNLVLGSSHGRDGFVPDASDYNLSNSSLDLYRIWKLYEYVVNNTKHDIKNVIIFWSVFHAGLQLEKTREFQRCASYKRLYNIEYASPYPTDDTKALKKVDELMHTVVCPENFRGQSLYNINHNTNTQQLVAKHLKNTNRQNDQIQHLKSIIKLARQQKHNVFIVLPPYRSDYLSFLPDDKKTYSELLKLLRYNRDVKLINLQRDTDFTDNDFESADHCNYDGGIKLTRKIKQFINKK